MIYKLKHIKDDKYFYAGDKRKDSDSIGEDETRQKPLDTPTGKVCQIENEILKLIPDNRGTRIYLKSDPSRSKIITLPGYTDPLYTTKVPKYPRYQIYIGTKYELNEAKKPQLIQELDNRYENEMEQKVNKGIEVEPGIFIPLTINTQMNLIGGDSRKEKLKYPVKVKKNIALTKLEFEAFYDASVDFKEVLSDEKFTKQEALDTKTMEELIIILGEI